MKLKTVRVRRSRPSPLAAALALMLTMLFVYILSLSAAPGKDAPASAQATIAEEVRMEGLKTAFFVEGRTEDILKARIDGAKCAQTGGAGLIFTEGGEYLILREAGYAGDGDIFNREADGLTLKLHGPENEVQAVRDAVNFLRAQAAETGELAAALEAKETDAPSIAALLKLYRTQGARAQSALDEISGENRAVSQLKNAVQAALSRLDGAIQSPDSGKLRLIHAAACLEWLGLLEDFAAT